MILVTGGTGFIGKALISNLDNVVVFDIKESDHTNYFKGDLMNPDDIKKCFDRYDITEVWHLAANPNVRAETKEHINGIIMLTNLLEGMRKRNVKTIYFTSSSVVYGDAEQIPTSEDYKTIPISMYGASKLACESIISSYCTMYGFHSIVFRLANIIGKQGHGIINDLISKLKKNPLDIQVFGDGKQSKSYLHIDNCVEAFLFVSNNVKEGFSIFNIGSEDKISVNEIIEIITSEMNVKPQLNYTGEKRGWPGDVPIMLLSTDKLRKLGFKNIGTSGDAIKKAIKEILT